MDSDSIIPDKNSSRLRSKRGSETLLWGQTDGCRGRQGHQYRGWSCSPENRSSYSVPMKPKASDISSGNCCWQYGLSVILRMNAAIQTDHPIFCKHLPLAVVCAASCKLPRRTVASSRPKEAVSTDHQHPTPYNSPMVCANTELKSRAGLTGQRLPGRSPEPAGVASRKAICMFPGRHEVGCRQASLACSLQVGRLCLCVSLAGLTLLLRARSLQIDAEAFHMHVLN